jgi:hypothetical protein
MRRIILCDTEQEFNEICDEFKLWKEEWDIDKLVLEYPNSIGICTLNHSGAITNTAIHKDMPIREFGSALFYSPDLSVYEGLGNSFEIHNSQPTSL